MIRKLSATSPTRERGLDPSCEQSPRSRVGLVSRDTRARRSSVRLCCVFCALLSGLLWLLITGGVFTAEVVAQEKAEANKAKDAAKPDVTKSEDGRYEFRKEHDPSGLGKFYMGREIALVMTFPHAQWLERPEREEEERLSELVKQLRLKPGMVVADVGAGSGVLSLMMAHEVGETGKVLAIDIQQEMLDLLGDKIMNHKIKNVELVLGTEKSPKLKESSIDLAVMVDVYHEFAYPYEMTLELAKALKPGGRIAFVEYRREDPQVPIKLVHKMTEAQVKKEVALPEFGLKWKETIDKLPRQHIVVFERSVKKDQ